MIFIIKLSSQNFYAHKSDRTGLTCSTVDMSFQNGLGYSVTPAGICETDFMGDQHSSAAAALARHSTDSKTMLYGYV